MLVFRDTLERGDQSLKPRLIDSLEVFKDPKFNYFHYVLDSKLKQLHQEGIGTTTRRAEVITFDTENRLWEERVLGSDTPQQLLDTLVFSFGLNFALRSGREQRKLRPDMVKIVECSDTKPYLLYVESGSKNHSGGLKERKIANKSVRVYRNTSNPSRCVFTMYKKYISLRPPNAPSDALYLQPLPRPSHGCWYYPRPVGHNVLSQTVQKLLDQIGVKGHFTNHSLRRTCATRLYQGGIDEQRIMAVTGHRSVEAVRIYKEMSDEQQEKISETIQAKEAPRKKFKMDPEEQEESAVDNLKGAKFNFSNCTVNFNYTH